MYHALRILDVKKDVISKGYSDLKGNVHFNTYALSQLNEFLVPLFFS